MNYGPAVKVAVVSVGPPNVGAQVATTRRVPRGRRDHDIVDLAGSVGLGLDPWQQDVLVDSTRTVGGQWSSFENVVIVPRQNGKTFLAIARILAGALLFDEKLILYSAHEHRTAVEMWGILRDICESDAMAPYVKGIKTKYLYETIWFTSGCRFQLVTRTRHTVRGMSPDVLLLDEAFAVTQDMVSAVVPAMAARPNPQLYYLSSAGTWEAAVLLGLRQRGHSRPGGRFAYWEWHAQSTDDFSDPRVWAGANPGLGHRFGPEAIEREHAAMSRKTFGRERLGVWSESTTEPVLKEADILDALVPLPTPPHDGRPIGWGVDVLPDRTGASIAAAYQANDGSVVLVLVDARPGAAWLMDRLPTLAEGYGAPSFAYDARGGIEDLMERANRDHGVERMPLRHSDYPAACANLAQRLAEGTLRFGQAPPLLTDAASASARSTSNGWVWDRKVTTPPTHLIAATCALWALDHDPGGGVAIY
jgi:hypothetical protein